MSSRSVSRSPPSSEEQEKPKPGCDFIVPDTRSNLKVCVECGLAKSKKQWDGVRECENCGTFMRVQTGQNVTTKYNGLIALLDPKQSFIRKRAKVYARSKYKKMQMGKK